MQPLASNPDVLCLVLNRHRVAVQAQPNASAAALRHCLEHLEQFIRDEDCLLDVLETVISFYDDGALLALETTLEIGNSAYTLNDGRTGLQFRIDPTVQAQITGVITETGPATFGSHLRDAFNAAYGRQVDPPKSYSESIKAVECATIPVVEPNHARATLGTVRGELRSNPNRWAFAINGQGNDSIEPVTGMVSLLWDGQTSRHGGVAATKPETVDAARSAVHLAGTLCQWFSSGAVRRR